MATPIPAKAVLEITPRPRTLPGPVRVAVENGHNGLLLDFFDVEALSNALIQACRSPEGLLPLRYAARETVLRHFDRDRVCRPAWLQAIRDVQPILAI